MKLILSISLMLLITSCSSLSKNMTKSGDFVIKNGNHKDISWDEDLKFDRYSWYHEWTLLLDVMMAEVDKNSSFYNWFSRSEKGLLNRCSDAYITMSYHLDPDRISQKMFLAEMQKLGYEKIITPRFSKAMELHPDHESQSLQLYKSYVLCRERVPSMKLAKTVTLPSFSQVKIK